MRKIFVGLREQLLLIVAALTLGASSSSAAAAASSASAAASSAASAAPPPCAPTLDPPALMRYGADFLSQPLSGANATLDACVALCCASAASGGSCVAFSFNSPQPSRTCVGGACCEAGGACCMLKGEPALPLVNNTYGGAVRTGSVPPAPGPAPPFERSLLVLNVTFGAVQYWEGGNNGDTWPSAWLADGSVVGWDCDAHGSPMSLWRLDGDPYETNLTPTLVGGLQPIDYQALCAFLGPTGSYPLINVKPAGMAALPDGSLIVGVSCMLYGDDAVFNRQHNLAGFVARSLDGGATWANVTVVGDPALMGRFSAPVFVSCGRAYDDPQCLADGVLYVFFSGAFNNEAYWDNNDAMFLARVAPAAVANLSAYEYFSGLDGAGAPAWTPDASQAQPSLEFGNMVGENAVSYNPLLGRYLMANYGFIDNAGRPRPWHTKPFMSPHRTQLLLLEAERPWGPWRVFFASDDSGAPGLDAPGLYAPSFASAYMRGGGGSGAAQMQMLFACLGGSPSCRYTLNYVPLTLALNATEVERAATGRASEERR